MFRMPYCSCIPAAWDLDDDPSLMLLLNVFIEYSSAIVRTEERNYHAADSTRIVRYEVFAQIGK